MTSNKKTIAILFSDLHLGDYAKFNHKNKRTLSHFRVLSYIRKICIKEGCPAIFAGDLFHKPEVISNSFYEVLVKKFNKLSKGWTMYAISGNHDCSITNKPNSLSPSWVRSLSNQYDFLKCIDMQTIDIKVKGVDITITGIPYFDHNIGLNETIGKGPKNDHHILVLHTDYPGACDTDGVEVSTVENLNVNLLNKFRLTVIGHIHKPQRLAKKVYMIGAPLQQRRTDRNCKLGYWELKEDFTLVHKPISDKFPKFIDVSKEEDILDDGNYYTLVMSEKTQETTPIEHGITKNLTKHKLVRKYLKVKGIKDKERKQVLIQLLNQAE